MAVAQPLDVYVKNVLNFSSWGNNQALAEFNRKAVFDVLEKNASNLDSVLETLIVEEHSSSIVAILLAKMNRAVVIRRNDILEQTLTQIEVALPVLNKERVIGIPDLFAALFQKVFKYFINKDRDLMRGINLLYEAIDFFADGPGDLTSIHSLLFCLCLKARNFEPALKHLQHPVTKIHRENVPNCTMAMDPAHFLLYFYYGGLIYGTLGFYREAMAYFENVICVPIQAGEVSAITVEAYKKYILISLLLHDRVLPLSERHSLQLINSLRIKSAFYASLEKVCIDCEKAKKERATAVLTYLQTHHANFDKDGNSGLVLRIVRKFREASFIKLAKCFLTISLEDVARRCSMDSVEHAERYLVEMNRDGKIFARIDKRNRMVHIREIQPEMNEAVLDKVLQEGVRLEELLKSFDERMRTSPAYIMRTMKSSFFSSHDDEGFQQGSLHSYSSRSFSPTTTSNSFEMLS